MELGSLCGGEYLISLGNSSAFPDGGCSVCRIQSQSISFTVGSHGVGCLGPGFLSCYLCAGLWFGSHLSASLSLSARTGSRHSIKSGRGWMRAWVDLQSWRPSRCTSPLLFSPCLCAARSWLKCRGVFCETAAPPRPEQMQSPREVAADAQGEAGRGSLARPAGTWYPNWL